MLLDTSALLVAAAAGVAIVTAAAASIGVRQKLRRGVWWWTGANAALVVALVVLVKFPGDAMSTAMASVLALQWPVVTLFGLRRFFSRGGAGVPSWADGVALGCASAAVAAVAC